MHSVVQAALGVWQFRTKSRAEAKPIPRSRVAGQILAQDHCTTMVPVIPGCMEQ
jgi:hypothetical protein